jgi:hypothetical protein
MRNVSYLTAVLSLALAVACSRPSSQPQQQAATTPAHEAHASGTAQAELPALTVDQLSAMLDAHESVFVFDANARERYEVGHVPTARHVGHDPVVAAMLPPDHGARLVFYCANEH